MKPISAPAMALACWSLLASGAFASQRQLVSKVDAAFQERDVVGLKITFANGLLLQGDDQTRTVFALLPDGSKFELKNVAMHATDDAIYLIRISNGSRMHQIISRTIDADGGDFGAHLAWIRQNGRYTDDIEVYEKKSVDGECPLGGSRCPINRVEDLSDGTIRGQSGEIISPIIPKAWLVSTPYGAPPPQPQRLRSGKGLEDLKRAVSQ